MATLLLSTTVVRAENLVEIYEQALKNDPSFKQAQATWLSAQQTLPLAKTGNGTAGTGLFPNLSITDTYANTHSSSSGSLNADTTDANTLTINLVQPLFNLATWNSIKSAQYAERAAFSAYLAATQDLIQRVESAYFEVLRANDNLNLTIAQKKQFKEQLDTSEQKFKVGAIAATGFYEAKAGYDQSVADEIKSRNNVENQLENLRAITGTHYKQLAPLKKNIPLLVPEPVSIEKWVEVALRQNYTIQSDLNSMQANREAVKVAASGFAPSVNGIASYANTSGGNDFTVPEQTQIGVSLNIPLISGGFTLMNTRQARYNYLVASDQVQLDRSTVEKNTRQSYLGIESGIHEITADQNAIFSSQKQLAATKAGYSVGTRTMEDVLDSVSSLTQAQLTYANDRYDYVEGLFQLKQQAGILSPDDIKNMNAWLNEPLEPLSSPPAVPADTAKTAKPIAQKKNNILPPPIASPATDHKAAYGIEIFSAHSKKYAQAWYDQHKSQYPLELNTTGSGETGWSRVIYGSYASINEAKQALKDLPPVLKTYKPWIVDLRRIRSSGT